MTVPAPQPRLVILTPQQRRVVGHLTDDGASDNEIAALMGLSPWTVHSHVRDVLERTGARSRTQLVVWLLRRRIVIRTENHTGGFWQDPVWRREWQERRAAR